MNTALAQASTIGSNSVSLGTLSDENKRKVEQFCEAVRAKQKWYFKILDEERDLGTKWAQEAGYLQLGPEGQTSWTPVDFAIRDAIECVPFDFQSITAIFIMVMDAHDHSFVFVGI